jgi:hypothetical protein
MKINSIDEITLAFRKKLRAFSPLKYIQKLKLFKIKKLINKTIKK